MQEAAALMTLAEYQTKVTPLFKNFNKFLRKYGQYLKKDNYSGVTYLTYPEFVKKETEGLTKRAASLASDMSYINSNWYSSVVYTEKSRVLDEIPTDVKKQYDDFITEFRKYFTAEEISNRIDRDEVKSNKRSIRRAIDNDFYIDALKDGVVTPARLEEIFNSNGIRIPKRILELKTKVETQGYDRSVELAQTKKTKEFEEILRKALGPHYDELKSIEIKRVLKIASDFDNFENKSGDFYYFLKQFDKFHTHQQYVSRILNDLYEGVYATDSDHRKVYVKKRRENFDQLVEAKGVAFAEDFIRLFVARIELKLRVVNAKLGAPTIAIKDVTFGAGEFEGLVTITWSNGVVLNVNATVIIAGGYNIQSTHYRYLLKTFHNGKFIDLEDIDALNFVTDKTQE